MQKRSQLVHTGLGFANATAEISLPLWASMDVGPWERKFAFSWQERRGFSCFSAELKPAQPRVVSEGGVNYRIGRDVMIWAADWTGHSSDEAVVLLYVGIFSFFQFITNQKAPAVLDKVKTRGRRSFSVLYWFILLSIDSLFQDVDSRPALAQDSSILFPHVSPAVFCSPPGCVQTDPW